MEKTKLESSWFEQLGEEFEQPYMQELMSFLEAQRAEGKLVFPTPDKYFSAFERTPLKSVKVVILGQDPYHGPGQAHGLSFSVPVGVKIPPSLKNIFKEQKSDLNIENGSHGCLEHWADEGVLLLNSVLSVEQAKAASHQKKGWEQFTDSVIYTINEQCENVVFLLWGAYAQRKGQFIDRSKHCVLEAPHPSPLSAHRGFFGCKHFSLANKYLTAHGRTAVDWQLAELNLGGQQANLFGQ